MFAARETLTHEIRMIENFIWIAPALLLAMWAQGRVKTAFAEASRVPVAVTGAQAAAQMLREAGIQNVGIEQVRGQLSDHYDPRKKVLRLSEPVYGGRTAAAVGIAAHEAGHAIQDARKYAPLMIRNAAVPAAGFGSNFSFLLLFAGMIMQSSLLILVGIGMFACVVFFQLENLPVEFDASNRAKAELANMGICGPQEMTYVNRVLNAAAWTYVAATLHAVLVLLYFLTRISSRR
jgi:hypothetical protein